MVGLDAAGKTTILYKLKLGEVVTTIPTIGAFAFFSFLLVEGVCVCVYDHNQSAVAFSAGSCAALSL